MLRFVGATDTWTIDSDVIDFDDAFSGDGGHGGAGFAGGVGGNSHIAAAGGIWDEFLGTLKILHSAIAQNMAAAGLAGKGGAGFFQSAPDGMQATSDAGGLFISPSSTACATADTQIVNNAADTNPDVDGILGVC